MLLFETPADNGDHDTGPEQLPLDSFIGGPDCWNRLTREVN